MSWVIRGYDAVEEQLRFELPLDDALRRVFRRVLDRPDDDPMVDSFPLRGDALRQVNALLGLNLGMSRDGTEFFLDFDA
jgi:hypothetical protein